MNESIFKVNYYEQRFDHTTSEPHYLLPFGDVHYKNPGFHKELWEEWCVWASEKPRSIFIGMGDFIELFSDSERRGMNCVNLHQSSQKTMDDFAKSICDEFIENILFMRGKLLGMHEGNHFYQFQNGMTSTQYMCQKLDCPYLGATALTRISFNYSKTVETKSHWRASVDVFSHHGKGASRLVGGSLNTVQQMAECAEANIYLMGHDHKKSIGMSSKLGLTQGKSGIQLREKRLLYARTGSFLKSYENEKPSYVAKALLNPSDLGTVKIELTPKIRYKKGKKRWTNQSLFIDIHASL